MKSTIFGFILVLCLCFGTVSLEADTIRLNNGKTYYGFLSKIIHYTKSNGKKTYVIEFYVVQVNLRERYRNNSTTAPGTYVPPIVLGFEVKKMVFTKEELKPQKPYGISKNYAMQWYPATQGKNSPMLTAGKRDGITVPKSYPPALKEMTAVEVFNRELCLKFLKGAYNYSGKSLAEGDLPAFSAAELYEGLDKKVKKKVKVITTPHKKTVEGYVVKKNVGIEKLKEFEGDVDFGQYKKETLFGGDPALSPAYRYVPSLGITFRVPVKMKKDENTYDSLLFLSKENMGRWTIDIGEGEVSSKAEYFGPRGENKTKPDGPELKFSAQLSIKLQAGANAETVIEELHKNAPKDDKGKGVKIIKRTLSKLKGFGYKFKNKETTGEVLAVDYPSLDGVLIIQVSRPIEFTSKYGSMVGLINTLRSSIRTKLTKEQMNAEKKRIKQLKEAAAKERLARIEREKIREINRKKEEATAKIKAVEQKKKEKEKKEKEADARGELF